MAFNLDLYLASQAEQFTPNTQVRYVLQYCENKDNVAMRREFTDAKEMHTFVDANRSHWSHHEMGPVWEKAEV